MPNLSYKGQLARHDTFFAKACSPWNTVRDCSAPKAPQFSSNLTTEGNGKITFCPERVKASVAWDMWGFGLIMTQILLGQCMQLTNFEKAEDAMIKKLHLYDDKTLQTICSQLNLSVGKEASDLVYMLLQKDPSKRPCSMGDVINHPYFQELSPDI
jgi:hypothetical protein